MEELFILSFGDSSKIEDQYAYIKIKAQNKVNAELIYKKEYPKMEEPKHIWTEKEFKDTGLKLSTD